jgi:uncharacterized protein (TIGR03032 family)
MTDEGIRALTNMPDSFHEACESLWTTADSEYRSPAEVIQYPQGFTNVDQRLLEFQIKGNWWDILGEAGITLLVSREYENLLISMCADEKGEPRIGIMKMPHPSGITVDRKKGVVHVASTRNPNQIFDLIPVYGLLPRRDVGRAILRENPLMPVRSRFFPGCLYIHDLAMINDELYANSVGQNAVVKIDDCAGYEIVWWPKCVETDQGPNLDQNHIQLNSIAPGEGIENSFYCASTDTIGDIGPGNPDFEVDGKGVIFSGLSREPFVGNLTRPHSVRLYAARLWVDNSGYGQVGYIDGDVFRIVASLPGWTRGLCFFGDIVFVGVSRVLSRFEKYAPGVEASTARCGIYALSLRTGEILGCITWPYGSQIFAVEWVPTSFTTGFAFKMGTEENSEKEKILFYSYDAKAYQENKWNSSY